MLVALSILIILMAAVGEIFSLAGRTVRVGQATLAAMSSIRAVESQIAHDIHHLDTNGFLVIRQRYYAPYWQTGVQYEPGDEVEFTGSFYLCQQANVTQTGYSGTPLSVPGGTSATVWQPLTLPAAVGQYPIWRADQICFMETGNFQSRSGSVQPYAAPTNATMASYLASNKAMVWFGQMTASYASAPSSVHANYAALTNEYSGGYLSPGVEQPCWPQDSWVPQGTPPSGQTSGQYYFGREATLLVPPGSLTFGSVLYADPFYYGAVNPAANGSPGVSSIYPYTVNTSGSGYTSESESATATSSRLDAAYDAVPPALGIGTIEGYISSLPDTTSTTSLATIADYLCYRYSTLITPAASDVDAGNPVEQNLNGYYRMAPIMLQGVPSFAVDWTDGTSALPVGATVTQLEWYGLDGNTGPRSSPTITNTNGPMLSLSDNTATPVLVADPATGGEDYVFYAGNRPEWPKALKITYAVTDPNNRLQGGRFVTQVVKLPQ